MKYIITDKNEVRMGAELHQDLAKTCEGRVVRAGHVLINNKGNCVVYGRAHTEAFNIDAQPEDAKILDRMMHGENIVDKLVAKAMIMFFLTFAITAVILSGVFLGEVNSTNLSNYWVFLPSMAFAALFSLSVFMKD